MCPKWTALTDIVQEIKEEIKLNQCDHPPQKILVFVSDERVRQQLEDLLTIGSKDLLTRMFNKYLGEKFGLGPPETNTKEPKDKGKGKGKKSNKVNEGTTEIKTEENIETEYSFTIIQSLHIGSFAINRLIGDIKPR